MNNGKVHAAAVMNQLRAYRIGKAYNGVLGAAIRRLQRDRSVSQSRADLNYSPAISRFHSLECGHRSVDTTQVRDFRGAFVLVGPHVDEGRKNGCHGVVDPNVDGAELALG